ncbi:MAG TPA: universal stress protein [bacterium]
MAQTNSNNNIFSTKKILVPVDFSKHSKISMDYAIALAKISGAEILVFHVFEKPAVPQTIWMSKQVITTYKNYFKEVEKKTKDELQNFLEKFDTGNIEIKTKVKLGLPYLEIIDIANKENVDLIVIGTRGLTVFQKMLIGSTADRIVRKAKCNVLLVRSKR